MLLFLQVKYNFEQFLIGMNNSLLWMVTGCTWEDPIFWSYALSYLGSVFVNIKTSFIAHMHGLMFYLHNVLLFRLYFPHDYSWHNDYMTIKKNEPIIRNIVEKRRSGNILNENNSVVWLMSV